MTTKEDTYLSINASANGVFKDKGSKFLSFAYPVKNENEIKEIIDNLRKEYFDARHHCYAYRLGAGKLVFRTYDDGEPSGTAGKPILGQIQSNDLTNILIAVIRYFGGTLLGTGGLINAYRHSAADAIANAVVVQKHVFANYLVSFGYQQMNQVMKVVKDNDLETLNQNFELTCTMQIKIKLGIAESIVSKLLTIENVKIELLDIE